MKKLLTTITCLLLLTVVNTEAQTSQLSIQGVLRKANGTAVENGQYDITFKLYTTTPTDSIVWEDTMEEVDVEGGIYSVILGSGNTPLDARFDQPYTLGVAIEGGTELIPRAQLTSSPYALSLIGNDNVFPNSGNVGVGSADPQHKLTIGNEAGTLGFDVEDDITNNATITTKADGIEFLTEGADNAYYFTGEITEVMRIKKDGKVGIGTADPQNLLHLVGDDEQIKVEGTDNARLIFLKTGANAEVGFNATNGNNLVISNPNNNVVLSAPNGNTEINGNNISLDPTNDPVKINKNAESLRLIGEDHTFLSFYPEGANSQRGGYLGFSSSTSSNIKITNEKPEGDIRIETDGGQVNINSYLRVNGLSNYWLSGRIYDNSGNNRPLGGTVNVGIASAYAIQAPEFFAVSDQRIKKDFEISNGLEDLAQLNKIKVNNYSHIDTLRYGTRAVKGLVAQQVKSVFPEAVMLNTEYIPNIYSFATQIDFEDQFIKITLKNPHNLKVDDKVKIITPNGEEHMIIQNVNDDFSFSVNLKDIKIEDKIFVYGKEVDDFHSVDYDRVFTLAVSAMQELARKVEALEKENARLQNLNADTEKANLALKAEMEGFSARLKNIENIFNATGSN